ncbi:MAG: hypothetical protein R3C18_10185 [Planctomycetaceae bacterium]
MTIRPFLLQQMALAWLGCTALQPILASEPVELARFNCADGQTVLIQSTNEDAGRTYSAGIVAADVIVPAWRYRTISSRPLQCFGCTSVGANDLILTFVVNCTKDASGLILRGDESRNDYRDAVLYVAPCSVGEEDSWRPPDGLVWFGYVQQDDGSTEFRGAYDGWCALMHLIHRDLGEELFKEVRGFPPRWESTSAKDDTVEIVMTVRQRRFKYWHRLNTDEWKVTLVEEK